MQPPEEFAVKSHISIQFNLLRFYRQNFARAVSLMDHCEDIVGGIEQQRAMLSTSQFAEQSELNMAMHQPYDWMQIAGRDAVMTVYHFGVMLDAIKRNVGRAPSLRAIDHKRLKGAWTRFLKSFPVYESQRHAVAHLADDMSTREKLDALMSETGPTIAGGLEGRTYVMSYNKGRMDLDVTNDTLTELSDIMAEAFEAFRPVSA